MIYIKNRAWIVPDDEKVIGTKGEFDVEAKVITVDRYTNDGDDLSTGSAYIAGETEETKLMPNYLETKDVTEDTIIYVWKIGKQETRSVGELAVALHVKIATADEVTDSWKSYEANFVVKKTVDESEGTVEVAAVEDATAQAIAQVQAAADPYEKKSDHAADITKLSDDLTELKETVANLDNTGTDASKVAIAQGSDNFGKFLYVDSDGNVALYDLTTMLTELKTAISDGDTDSAVAILDEAILDLSTLAPDDEDTKTLTGISVVYNGDTVNVGTTTSNLDITVTANYSNGDTETVTSGYTLSPSAIVAGENAVTVTYNGKSATFTVTGKSTSAEVVMESITAVFNGTTSDINVDAKDLDITVTAHYSDGTTATITDYSISGTVAEGENTFTVTYNDKTCTVTVTGEEQINDDAIFSSYAGALTNGDNTPIKMWQASAYGTEGTSNYRIQQAASGTGALSNQYKVSAGETYTIKCTSADNTYNNAPTFGFVLFYDKTKGYDSSKQLYLTDGYVKSIPDSTLKGTNINYTVTVPDGYTRMSIWFSGARYTGTSFTDSDSYIADLEPRITITKGVTS